MAETEAQRQSEKEADSVIAEVSPMDLYVELDLFNRGPGTCQDFAIVSLTLPLATGPALMSPRMSEKGAHIRIWLHTCPYPRCVTYMHSQAKKYRTGRCLSLGMLFEASGSERRCSKRRYISFVRPLAR